jgi:hypothetical protein
MRKVISTLIVVLISSVHATPASNMSVDEVLADGCVTTPDNISISNFWNQEMNVVEAWCKYPPITKSDVSGRRKPQAFVHGSSGSIHDVQAVKTLSGTGESDETLGVSPRTNVTFGLYCTDANPLASAKPGDVVFSLHGRSDVCSFMNPLLPTIPVFGIDNTDQFIGDEKHPHGLHISSGWNYGRAIDYFTPGGAPNILARGNVSTALPEFSGVVVALNAALISQNHAVLSNDTIRAVLDASSDEVYLEVDGFRGIYTESELDNMPSASNIKYYGQLVNLSNAINIALKDSPTLALLTILKNVNNDNGGDAIASDFTLRVTGGIYDDTVARVSGEWLRVGEGVTYSLGEDLFEGEDLFREYAQTSIECKDDDTKFPLAHPVTLDGGQSATCTINNDDIAPEIKIITEVVNERDGTAIPADFTLRLNGGSFDGSIPRLSEDLVTVDANTAYTLYEDQLPGYTRTGIECTDADTDVILPHPVTLAEGQSARCTISNADNATNFYLIPMPDNGAAIFDL